MLENVKIAAGMVFLLLYWGIVPSMIGIAGSSILCRKRKVGTAEAYIWGNIILWTIFQILCVFMGCLKVPFTVLTIVFSGVVLLLWLISIRLNLKYGRIRRGKLWESIKKIKQIPLGVWVVVVLVLIQVASFVYGMSYSGATGDDAAYIAISLDAVERDKIGTINYYTGLPTGVPLKILLTSWNYYISFLSKISGVHVAIIAHTFLPVILVPMAYIVYYLLAKELFENDKRKITVFLIAVNLLIIFGAYSWYTVTFRLDVCVWQGKAVMAAIMLPFLLYYVLKTTVYQKWDFVCLLLIMIATCAMSLMGVGLSILMIIGVIVVRFHKGDIKKLLPLFVAVILILSVAVFYFMKMSSLDSFSYEHIKQFFPKATDMALGAYSLYWNGTWMRWAYIICLIYWVVRRKADEKSCFLKKYILWQYIVIFNPVFYYIAYNFLRAANVYVRLYYILFPEIYMAYILTSMIFEFKKKWQSIVVAVVCGAFIIGSGKTYQTIAWYYKAPNLYKILPEAIEMCDLINEDSTEKEPRVLVSDGMCVYIRQYSSRIQMLYGRYGYDYKRNNILSLIQNNQITMEEIVQLMRENDCQYLVWKYDEKKIAEAEALGGSVVGRTDSYVIVKLENVQGK